VSADRAEATRAAVTADAACAEPDHAVTAGLVITGAGYRYAGSAAMSLRDVSLALSPGRVVGVAGPNESGKTTLCLVAAGLAPAAIGGSLSGGVRIDGLDTATLRPHDLAQTCGLLFQNATTQLSGATATVFEEVAFGPCNLGLPTAEISERVWWALRTVGVAELAARDPARLSGGQGQLVALASVLALRPKYLILDEPTSQLDPAGTALVADALVRVAAETGAGILLAEHKMDVLARVADDIVVLDRGAVVLAGPAAAVLADPRLADFGIEPPPSIRLERETRAAGLEWSAEIAEAAVTAGRSTRRAAGAPGVAAGSGAGSASSVAAGSGVGAGWRAARAPGVAAGSGSAGGSVPSIEFDGVSFVYPDGTRALDGVSLGFEPGALVAIVGQNGSGKSTLVRHLNGLLRPASGRLLLDGVDVRTVNVAELAGRAGLAFQNPDRQLFAGRVSAEVAFGPRNLGIRGGDLDDRVAAALESVGLGAEADANPYDLGYSRRKLLALASVLAMRTPILILDEPTTGQDARGVARVRAIVAEAAAEGRTVIAISHDMRFAAECFRRIVVLRAGRVVLDGSPDVVFGEGSWPELRTTFVEPPPAAVAGARLGLGVKGHLSPPTGGH
jgi:energy-coupling factor transporter ATP-binding protein EcfA2